MGLDTLAKWFGRDLEAERIRAFRAGGRAVLNLLREVRGEIDCEVLLDAEIVLDDGHLDKRLPPWDAEQ